jgi:hypothetical protein
MDTLSAQLMLPNTQKPDHLKLLEKEHLFSQGSQLLVEKKVQQTQQEIQEDLLLNSTLKMATGI